MNGEPICDRAIRGGFSEVVACKLRLETLGEKEVCNFLDKDLQMEWLRP